MKQKRTFTPTEIIFAATDACNLHCKHCFVSRNPQKLDIQTSIDFINRCKDTSIQKIGFSGGEPFLYLDFILELTKAAVKADFLFDQIMTNGDWWQTEKDLQETLQKVYDAGYDGKIGLSWDTFHGQDTNRMFTFIKTVQEIFGEDSLIIQEVADNMEGGSLPLASAAFASSATPSPRGQSPKTPVIYTLPQTFPSQNEKGWKSKKWFKDDYCQGPGNIFFVHSNGNIAPCCGFANENQKLIIGNINQTFQQIMKNASENEFVKICFEKGLKKEIKKQIKKGHKTPGKTNDICTACDFLCKI